MSVFSGLWSQMKDDTISGMNGVVGAYTQGIGSFAQAKAEQVAARFAPEVDFQNRGAPVSVKPQTEKREFVGDKPVESATDKKWLMLGGGALVLVAVVGLTLAARKR